VRILFAAALLIGGVAAAQPAPPPAPPVQATIALFHLEPLGIDSERAVRLEGLFRLELERMANAPLAARAQIERVMAKDPNLRGCTGEPDCLAEIGKQLGVKQVVAGNVAQLGDSYVVNLKLVDVATKAEVRKISEPLRGDPDQLIEAVRVAAYELVTPDKLLGGIAVLSDVAGAIVTVDGKAVGKTPLAKPISDLPAGKHTVQLAAVGYTSFTDEVDVHFQKTTQVEVRMIAAGAQSQPDNHLIGVGPKRPATTPWYASKWTYLAVGVTAIIVGAAIGHGAATSGSRVTSCETTPTACGLAQP
jgi:hypothetical protein